MEINKKIGIYGGTFDPIHIGHLHIAEMARISLKLEKIFFVPSANPIGKIPKESIKNRILMVKIAIGSNPFFEIANESIINNFSDYTIDTIESFKSLYPEYADNLYFIMGSDAFIEISKWKSYEKLIESCYFAIFNRSYKQKDLISDIKNSNIILKNAHFLDFKTLNISSTEIRNNYENNISSKYLLSENVYNYIKLSNLYLSTINFIKYKLKIELSYPRYIHSINVCEAAKEIYESLKLDKYYYKKIEIASLLHDCAKNYCEELDYETLNNIYTNNTGANLDIFFKNSTGLSHSYIGAIFAKNDYNINDLAILNAIKNHTFGSIDMGIVCKVVYIADFISIDRPDSEIKKNVKNIVFFEKDLDKAIIYILKETIKKNEKKGIPIYHKTKEALIYMEEKNGNY